MVCRILIGLLGPYSVVFLGQAFDTAAIKQVPSNYLEIQWLMVMAATLNGASATLASSGLLFWATWLSRQFSSVQEHFSP